jgi:putative ABC transport system permease protein
VALVNESFARRFLAGQEPVGHRIRIGGATSKEPWRTVIGVVPDLHVSGPDNDNRDGIYVPMAQSPQRFASIVLRTRGEPLAITERVREVVTAMDPDLPIYHVNSLAGAIRDETWFYRVFGVVFTVLGGVALFLASIGLYGVMAFSVKRRTREVGIRIALGAQLRDVLQLILAQGFRQVAIGLVIGLSLAAIASQAVRMALFRVEPHDPIVFGAVVVTLVLSGLAACLVPALRATRVDPLTAIRAE